MNILQCLLILSALASLLVTGPNLAPVQSYAAAAGGDNGDYKITKDYKDSIHKDVNAKSDSTNQHLSQDNLCYRDDGCEQANEGEQIKGKDNAASGFNDQSKNVQQSTARCLPVAYRLNPDKLSHHHTTNRHPPGHKERHLPRRLFMPTAIRLYDACHRNPGQRKSKSRFVCRLRGGHQCHAQCRRLQRHRGL